jgi:hypothetical protein
VRCTEALETRSATRTAFFGKHLYRLRTTLNGIGPSTDATRTATLMGTSGQRQLEGRYKPDSTATSTIGSTTVSLRLSGRVLASESTRTMIGSLRSLAFLGVQPLSDSDSGSEVDSNKARGQQLIGPEPACTINRDSTHWHPPPSGTRLDVEANSLKRAQPRF